MRKCFRSFVAVTLLSLASSCVASPRPPEPEYLPTATVKDIMDSMMDPSADFLWDSVETNVGPAGTEDKAPKTDEEWTEVRRRAIILMEATNLLLIPGRHIAHPGQKADDPKVELAPEIIENMVNGDRQTWTKLAHGLHNAAEVSLKAIDGKNAEELLNSGNVIDKACGDCHMKYWYPEQEKILDKLKQEQDQRRLAEEKE